MYMKESITRFIGSEVRKRNLNKNSKINSIFLKAKEFIAVLPKEYDDNKKSLLEGQFQKCGIKLLKYEKSELDQMINIIMNLSPKYEEHHEVQNDLELIDLSLQSFNEVDYDDKNSFVVEMKENGDVKVGILKDNKFMTLPYNMGLPKTTLKYKYCTNSQEEKTVLGFKSLLDYSFGTLGKTGPEIEQIQSDFFQVINFKDSLNLLLSIYLTLFLDYSNNLFRDSVQLERFRRRVLC